MDRASSSAALVPPRALERAAAVNASCVIDKRRALRARCACTEAGEVFGSGDGWTSKYPDSSLGEMPHFANKATDGSVKFDAKFEDGFAAAFDAPPAAAAANVAPESDLFGSFDEKIHGGQRSHCCAPMPHC